MLTDAPHITNHQKSHHNLTYYKTASLPPTSINVKSHTLIVGKY